MLLIFPKQKHLMVSGRNFFVIEGHASAKSENAPMILFFFYEWKDNALSLSDTITLYSFLVLWMKVSSSVSL
jgi:hypothetical protein